MGLLIAVAFVVPMAAGLALDGAAGTSPLFLIVGLVVGVALAAAVVVTRFRRYL